MRDATTDLVYRVVRSDLPLADVQAVVQALRDHGAAAAFLAAVVREWRRDHSEIDAWWLEETAVNGGLLAYVDVDAPCGEVCFCEEWDAFPQRCLRPTPLLERLLARADGAAASSQKLGPGRA